MSDPVFTEEITKIGNAIGLEGKFLADFGFQQIMAILAPEPEMEEVAVDEWANFVIATGQIHNSGLTEESAKKHAMMRADLCAVRLTGSYLRPKPQPTVRSVSVVASVDGRGECYPPELDLSAYVFQKNPECCGKTGTLTFTWTEE